MWLHAGVVRSAAGLEQALASLEAIRERADGPASGTGDAAAALDLRSMLLTAEATVRSALLRTESRGAHQRTDFPATDPAWQRTIVVLPAGRGDEQPGLKLATFALPEPSPELAAAIDESELEVAGHLLE